MGKPRYLDKYEAAAVLAPITWDVISGKAKIGTPIPGNNEVAGVRIILAGRHPEHVFMRLDQYELYRTEVLQPITGTYYLEPFQTAGSKIIERRIRELILEVFDEA